MNIVIGVLIALALFVLLNEITLMLTGHMLLIIAISSGSSMEPAIDSRTTVHIIHYPLTINEGDIIAFEDDDGNKVLHRVISRKENKVLPKGDNNYSDDGWHHTDAVIGKTLRDF